VTEPVVRVADLVKRYGELEAVRGINSTTIKILCTLANPTSGSARVARYDVLRQRDGHSSTPA
jgi:ABC-2 type transport system ATP-binding protein